jgi:hypothetical protein
MGAKRQTPPNDVNVAIAAAIAAGLVEYDPVTDTLRITDKGREEHRRLTAS